MQLLVATSQGLAAARATPTGWEVSELGLDNRKVTCALSLPRWILAGTEEGVYRFSKEGKRWEFTSRGLSIPHIRWMATPPDTPDHVFAGTEPAGIFFSPDQGRTWHPRPEIQTLNSQLNWYLPYSPAAGCVRGFAFHKMRAYAAVEVGGVLTSDDRGHFWKLVGGSDGIPSFGLPAPGRIHPDVHDVLVVPSNEKFLLAPTGGGVYQSMDAGKSWTQIHSDYCRALWVDFANPRIMIAGPAQNSTGAQGRIELTRDGGETWVAAGKGAGSPWRRNMVERFASFDGHLFAVLADGQALISAWPELSWEPLFGDLIGIQAIAAMG